MSLIKNLVYRLRGEYTTEELIRRGMKVGKNFQRMKGCSLDPSHCWLIKIGDSVTLAPGVTILCHDASTKMFLGYTKIGDVTIGSRSFVGAGTIILPGVRIGDDVIIGAGSVVTKDVPSNTVVAGNPAKVIMGLDSYLEKEKVRMQNSPVYSSQYTLSGNITELMKEEQRESLKNGRGFVE